MFSVLLALSPSVGVAYGGLNSIGTTKWIGTGDGTSWSDPNNWDRQNALGPLGQVLPQNCDIIIIDDGTNAVTVHFDLAFFDFVTELQVGSDDTLIIDEGKTLSHQGPDADEYACEEEDETIINNGNLIIFGTLSNNGQFINNGQVLDCGTISGTVSVPGIVNECQVIGGEIIPIETVSLLLASAQSFSWMIPVVLSVAGIAIVLVRRWV